MPAGLAVVVVNYGSSELLAQNLVTTAAGLPGTPVLVFDNWSSAAERAAVEELAALHGWTVLASPANLGFGEAVNQAAARAFADGMDAVLVLNPDATVDADSVARLRSAAEAEPMTLPTPVIRTSAGDVWFRGADLYLEDGETRGVAHRPAHPDADVVPWITGACCVLTRQVFEATAGFDPEYFLYWEDVDLSWRASRAGVALRVLEDAVAVHDAGGTQHSTGRRGKSRVYYFYNTRNRLLFAAKNLDRSSVRRWLLATPRAAWRILMRGGRRQLVSDPGVVWAVVGGSLSGTRRALAVLRGKAPRA
jgi:GT2 family glycosyltransferase